MSWRGLGFFHKAGGNKNKILNKKTKKLKILGKGELKNKITLEVDFISNTVKEKLSKNGSTIKIKK